MSYKAKILALADGGTNANLTASNGGMLYSTASAIGILATANSGVLVTSGAGVPSVSSTLPTAVQGNITSTGNLGNQTNTTRTCFLVSLTNPISDVTGDSSSYDILYDTINIDQNGDIVLNDGGNTVFNVPITGTYVFTSTIQITNVSSLFTSFSYQANFLNFGSFTLNYLNPGACGAAGYFCQSLSFMANLTAGDQLSMGILVGTHTKTIGLAGSGGFFYGNFLSGYLLC